MLALRWKRLSAEMWSGNHAPWQSDMMWPLAAYHSKGLPGVKGCLEGAH